MARELFSHSAEERARSTRQGRGRPVFCRFPSPSGQKNSCGVNAHKNGALRQIPAALCIRPTGRTGSPVPPETAHSLFRCFCAAKKRPPAPQQAFSFRIPAFCRMPSISSTTPRSLQRRTGGLLLDRSFQYALPLAFLRYRPDAGETGELRGLPIHKTSVHADVCSGCYQNSILVWLIIVRCVSSLGSSGVSRWNSSVPNGSGMSGNL